jgi:hypothetical protein
MESLGFFQEPLDPTPVELESLEFLENTPLINFGVVSELSTLYERKDNRVFEAVEDGPNPVQGERVSREGVVRLHDTRWLPVTVKSVSDDCWAQLLGHVRGARTSRPPRRGTRASS